MANLSCSDGLVAVKCGGNWNDGVHCGARTVNMNDTPWNVNVNTGVRLACDEEKEHKKNGRAFDYGQGAVMRVLLCVRPAVFALLRRIILPAGLTQSCRIFFRGKDGIQRCIQL